MAEVDREFVEAALEYARRGWLVFAVHGIVGGDCTCGRPTCDRPGKHPLTEHGYKDATTDETVVRRWWRQWPPRERRDRDGTCF